MTTPRKLLASRLNGRLSRGPKTPAGKRASSQNALTHGIFANAPDLPTLGESAADWGVHRDGVVASLSPVGPAEFALAERAAHLLWRLRRAAQLDAAAYAVALRPAAPFAAPLPSDPCDLPPGVRGDGELTRRHADGVCARRTADAAARGADLLRRPDGAPDADPVAADVTAEVWRAACRACGRMLPTDARDLARRFRTGPTRWTSGSIGSTGGGRSRRSGRGWRSWPPRPARPGRK